MRDISITLLHMIFILCVISYWPSSFIHCRIFYFYFIFIFRAVAIYKYCFRQLGQVLEESSLFVLIIAPYICYFLDNHDRNFI